MTHMGPMPESAGDLSDAKPSEHACRKCSATGTVTYEEWSSSCGGYEDYKYTCSACGHVWWIDGIDS